ncbi:MAG: signal recognition particle-docking protein FtsY [Clostridiales bacterium]|nr:signal recognition particle-docking protein FtsY [Clostridiales bacterium]
MAFFNIFKKKKEEENEKPKNTESEILTAEEETEEAQEAQEEAVTEEAETELEVSDEITAEDDFSDETEENPVAEAEENEPVEETEIQQEPEPKKAKGGFFSKIKAGLQKTRENILSGVEQVLKGFTEIDDDLYDELEEALIMADIGVETSLDIISRVKEVVKKEKIKDVAEVKNIIVRVISEILSEGDDELNLPSPSIMLIIGVNGVGKTTTIGKLTSYYKSEGKSVMLAAADTFRAAAIDQLLVWGERNDVTVIRHSENSDPAAVVFDAAAAATKRNTDLLICDTAGRLHNKKNLMEELKKISRVIEREAPNAHKEVFLVLDATTGQNALQQAKLFKEVCDITGIILTKLDGTAKGGIVIAIKNELKIPVRFIGVGEGIDDLRPFEAESFARALFEE